MTNARLAISKVLSSNDTGETGGHQAGMLIPKRKEILDFFPDLGCEEKNPRTTLRFVDDALQTWDLNFIYYNNKYFDEGGTRNEYRLTGMTAFIRSNSLREGDTVILKKDNDQYYIYCDKSQPSNVQVITSESGEHRKRLVIRNDWKVIDY